MSIRSAYDEHSIGLLRESYFLLTFGNKRVSGIQSRENKRRSGIQSRETAKKETGAKSSNFEGTGTELPPKS